MPVSDVVEAVTEWKSRAPRYSLYRDYYDGKHRYKFATPKFLQTYRWVLEASRENLCPGVVSAFTDRLSIQSWGDGIALDEATEQGLSRLLNMVHREAFRCGDAFTLTWNGADGTPKATYQRADQMVPRVSELDPDRLDWAAKIWTTTGKRGRVNVYYPDRVERFITSAILTGDGAGAWPDTANGWQEFSDEDATGGGSSIIRHEFGTVPVCWWKRDADDQVGAGRSILHDVIPIQDELNKFVADMIVASERIAMPIRYALNMAGADGTTLVNGAPQNARVKFDPAVQSILSLPGAGPAGEFPGPDADKLIAMQNHAEQKIAKVVGVPSYYFSQTSGDVPSGESLRVLSSRLIAAVSDFQQDATPVWRGQMQLLGFAEPSLQWADIMPMDEAERVTIALDKQTLGYSLEDILTDLGETDVQGVLARAQIAQAVTQAGAVQAFNSGGSILD